MTTQKPFARRVFLIAGIYGLIAILPQYFLEARINSSFPPPITHPEFFYEFLGIALAWQFAFLVIARDVVRFRPLMLPAVAEKVAFSGAAIALYAQGRASGFTLAVGLIDLAIGLLFVAALVATPSADATGQSRRPPTPLSE